MEDKKEIYRGKAVTQKDEKQTIKALLKAAIFCLVIFAVSKYLPFSWVFEIGAIVLSAIYINKVLKQGTFIATYILYEDSLVTLTRYGLIELETARYDLSEAVKWGIAFGSASCMNKGTEPPAAEDIFQLL